MTVLIPGRLLPGHDAVVEHQSKTGAIADAATSCDLSFSLAGAFGGIPAIAGAPTLTKGTGSATTAITDWYVKSQSASAIVVTVKVDQAPGTGKSNTITMVAAFVGPQA